MRSSFRSTSSGVFPGASPVRLATLKMWVSTAMVGSPNAVLRITLAVLRPTPGSASSAARVLGVCPPCCSIKRLHVAMMLRALLLNSPMVLMYALRPASPRASIASGVGATRNSSAVALLTLASVACAERITAISNWNGLA